MPYGKSGPGYWIAFIERLDEGLKLQLVRQKFLILAGIYIQITWQKLSYGDLALWSSILLLNEYCCMQKMLKETETEEIIRFFVIFLLLLAIQLGGGRGQAFLPPWLRLCVSHSLVNYDFNSSGQNNTSHKEPARPAVSQPPLLSHGNAPNLKCTRTRVIKPSARYRHYMMQ